MTTSYTIREQQISHNRFDDEVIIVNLASGSYFSLHDTAAEIWDLMQKGPASAQSLAAAFSTDDPQAVRDIGAFLQQLLSFDVIAPGDATPSPVSTAAAYTQPTIEAFDELRELLLADIVHDTDEAGWPHLAAPQSS